MKTNKFCGILAVIFSALSLSSCQLFEDVADIIMEHIPTVKGQHENLTMIENSNIGYKQLPLVDMNSGLDVCQNFINTYFYSDKANPFISFDELILAAFSNKGVFKRVDNNSITYYREHLGKRFFVTFDPFKEEITTNTYSFFFANNFENYKYNAIESKLHVVKDSETIKLSLKKYNVNMFVVDNQIILPAYVVNVVFFSTSNFHLIYNFDSFILYNGYFDNESDYMKTRSDYLNNEYFCDGIYGARTEQIEFLLDYYYGLKDYKHIYSGHDLIYGKDSIINNLKQKNPDFLNIAYEDLFLHSLQDNHTSLGFKSYYHDMTSSNNPILSYAQSSASKEYNDNYNKLLADYENKGLSNNFIYYAGNTAFFKFDSFDFCYFDEILDNDGYFISNAGNYSTFALFYNAFNIIQEDTLKKNIKNIVIDLTTNGGGVIAAVPDALSFITDKPINCPQRNSLTNTYTIETYNIDNDLNHDYVDNDSFSNYNFYIATSPCTFSAANYFTAIAKDMGIAKIIGQKSGGGMCAVGNVSFLDGSTIKYSSDLILSGYHYVEGEPYSINNFYDIEGGVDVDIPISMDRIYDLVYIDSLLNKA